MFTFMVHDSRIEVPVTWELKVSPTGMNTISYSESLDRFVVAGGSSIYTSDDGGDNWTLRSSSGDNLAASVWCSDLSLFVVVGGGSSSGIVMTSPDGLTWTTQSIPSSFQRGTCVVWSPSLSLFVAGSRPGIDTNQPIITSPNGVTWTARTVPTSSIKVEDVAWSSSIGRFVTASGGVLRSDDGISWTSVAGLPLGTIISSVTWSQHHSLFVAFEDSGPEIATSVNGIDWSFDQLPSVEPLTWNDFVENTDTGVMIAYASSGVGSKTYAYSGDVLNWNLGASTYGWRDMIYVSSKSSYYGISVDKLFVGQHVEL